MKISTINSNTLTMKGQFQKNEELENVIKWASPEELQRFKNNLERMAKIDDKRLYCIERYENWFSPEDETYSIASFDYKFYNKNSANEQDRMCEYIELRNADSKLALINNQLEKLYPVNTDKEKTEDLKSGILNLLV